MGQLSEGEMQLTSTYHIRGYEQGRQACQPEIKRLQAEVQALRAVIRDFEAKTGVDITKISTDTAALLRAAVTSKQVVQQTVTMLGNAQRVAQQLSLHIDDMLAELARIDEALS